jgi:hypothetical protein
MLHGAPWRVTKGAAPDAVKAARPVLNGEDEETGLKVLRLVLTQHQMRVFLLSFGGLWRVFARLSFIPVFRDTPSAYQIRQYCLAYKISRLLSGSL